MVEWMNEKIEWRRRIVAGSKFDDIASVYFRVDVNFATCKVPSANI
jgi:hypothetical protein